MRPTAIDKPAVPLGLRFAHHRGGLYEVTEHYFGTHIRYTIECVNGWVLHFETRDSPLTRVIVRKIENGTYTTKRFEKSPDDILIGLQTNQLIQQQYYGQL